MLHCSEVTAQCKLASTKPDAASATRPDLIIALLQLGLQGRCCLVLQQHLQAAPVHQYSGDQQLTYLKGNEQQHCSCWVGAAVEHIVVKHRQLWTRRQQQQHNRRWPTFSEGAGGTPEWEREEVLTSQLVAQVTVPASRSAAKNLQHYSLLPDPKTAARGIHTWPWNLCQYIYWRAPSVVPNEARHDGIADAKVSTAMPRPQLVRLVDLPCRRTCSPCCAICLQNQGIGGPAKRHVTAGGTGFAFFVSIQ